MYVCFAAVGLLASFLITKQALNREHETTKTGLEEEEIKRQERVEKRRSKKAGNVEGPVQDLEKSEVGNSNRNTLRHSDSGILLQKTSGVGGSGVLAGEKEVPLTK